MKHTALHARVGTEAEFSEGNQVIPANLLLVVKNADTGAVEGLRVSDGVNEFEGLASFVPAP